MPCDCATEEWASSWTSTETKRSSALTKAIIQYEPGDQPGKYEGKKFVANDQVRRTRTISQLQWIAMSIPRIRPIRRVWSVIGLTSYRRVVALIECYWLYLI